MPCDRDELARRVDACIEQAKEDAVDCTLEALLHPLSPFSGLRYLACLENLRQRLLDCDRRAKRDTHCEDGRNDLERLAQATGLPPKPEEAG